MNKPKRTYNTFKERQIHTFKKISIIMAITTVAMIIFSVVKLNGDLDNIESITAYIMDMSDEEAEKSHTLISVTSLGIGFGWTVLAIVDMAVILLSNLLPVIFLGIGTLFQLGKEKKVKIITTVVFDILALAVIWIILAFRLNMTVVIDYKQILHAIFFVKKLIESTIYIVEFIIIFKLLIPKFKSHGGNEENEKEEATDNNNNSYEHIDM